MSTFQTYAPGNFESESNSSDSNDDLESAVYVLNLDGIPLYYQKTQEQVMENMWKIANTLCNTDINYNCFTEYSHPDTIRIYGKQRFIAVAYDKLHHVISFTKVNELIPTSTPTSTPE